MGGIYSVNSPESRESENPVHEPETEGSEKGLEVVITGFDKDGGRIESDDVDTTHLLCNHDRKSGKIGSSDPRDSEELCKPGDIVVLAHDLLLDL